MVVAGEGIKCTHATMHVILRQGSSHNARGVMPRASGTCVGQPHDDLDTRAVLFHSSDVVRVVQMSDAFGGTRQAL